MIDRRSFLTTATLTSAALALPAAARAAPGRSEDIRIVGAALAAIHPGLFRYLSPAAFERGIARLDQQWRASQSLEVRYLNLARFLATIRCGHSYPNFFNQKKAVAQQLFGGHSSLPFAFRWIAGSMVVTQDHSAAAAVPVGSVVKAVNGVPSPEILARLLPYVRADGSNDGKRRALLSPTGTDAIETFDVFYGLLYGAPRRGIFQLRTRAPGAAADTLIELPPIDLARRVSLVQATDPSSAAPLWQWQMGEDEVAVLTMDSWAVYDSKWDWQGWLNDRLSSLTGAKGLIVDLRQNEGGNDCGDLILARLSGTDIQRPPADRLVRYRQTPKALDPYLDTWDDNFRNWGADAEPFNDRYFRLKRTDNGVIAAQGPRVIVPMAVLTSPQNSSATFQFASLTRSLGLGKLIGGTTGGNQRGINGGAFFFVRLPESGLEFDLPIMGHFPPGHPPDAGLLPDIAAENSAADAAAGHDSVMETARHWVLAAR